jgi:two-component system, cell cycle sensor histidine kinase and response regulator CckA
LGAQRDPGHTLLLVDDNNDLRDMLRRTLEGAGYIVVAATGCHDAVGLAGSMTQAIDLLICDVRLSDGDGRDLADRLQRMIPDLHVLLMSGGYLTGRHLPPRTSFISKPFAAGELLAMVTTSLGSVQSN